MRRITPRLIVAVLAALALMVTTASVGLAHDSPNEGHIPKDVNYGFEVVGRDTLAGVTDGLYTDVWSHDGFAYIGTFQDPCTDAGVFVIDMAAAVANYPDTEGATVSQIKSAPNTRINDVKVHSVGDTDVLITTQEPCGMAVPSAAQSDSPFQVGQGGISLYDVTDPTKPKALKKNFLEFDGVHNTFAWDWDGKSYLIGTADTFDFFDTFFVDITKPQSPKLLSITGALDWIPQGANLDQVETGSSAGVFNHDVWVDIIDGVPTAVVSYWDLGFVTLDVTDPANPVFLDDSTYVDPEPIVGEPYEGNAHAAVFGGDGDYIFGGDEDFSPSSFAVSYNGVDHPAGIALFGADPNTLAGTLVWTGDEGCAAGDVPAATGPGQVALIQRGSCDFSLKGYNAEQQGYEGFVVANDAARGEDLINMSLGALPEPQIPGVFVGYSSGEAMKADPGLSVSATSVYDGWGYLHIINNTGGDVTVPVGGAASGNTEAIAQMGELGYYAPYQAVEEFDDNGNPFGTDFGDLTMHNIEADPLTQDITPGFSEGPRMFVSWYSLGMRALEYRPGHFHDNSNDEGSYSQNVHEVGRWIEEDGGSNFWGIHLDTMEIDGEDTQVILASDRNNGLYIFTFSCENPDGVWYCDAP